MEEFDDKFERYYKLLEEREEKIQNENDSEYKSLFGDSNKSLIYKNILKEPEIKIIQEQLVKLGERYNFKCNILMDGAYSNEEYTLHESHYDGPFKVVSNDKNFLFLENKKFRNVLDIEKEIEKEQIRILSGGNANNFTFVDHFQIISIFRCRKCNCFDALCKKQNKFSLYLNSKFEHKDIDYYENRLVEKNIQLNGSISNIWEHEFYKCVNCSAKLISEIEAEKLYALVHAKIEPYLFNISSSRGGSISSVIEHAILQRA